MAAQNWPAVTGDGMACEEELKKLFDMWPTRNLISSQQRIDVSADLNGRVIPLFTLSRGKAGLIWGVRKDVPEKITAELDQLAREENPTRDFEEPPLNAEEYQKLLGGQGKSGPAFGFPQKIDGPSGVNLIDRLDLLERHFRGWKAEEIPSCTPIVAIIDGGYPVSVCFCASGTSMPAFEAGVETAASIPQSWLRRASYGGVGAHDLCCRTSSGVQH